MRLSFSLPRLGRALSHRLSDTTAPVAPVLSNAAAGDGTVSFDIAPLDDAVLMHVYRDTGGGEALLETVSAAASYTDSAAVNDVSNAYRVQLEDAAGNVGAFSNQVSATPTTPP